MVRWLIGRQSNEKTVYDGLMVVPDYSTQYRVLNGHDIEIVRTQPSHADRYTCDDTRSMKTASAQLVIFGTFNAFSKQLQCMIVYYYYVNAISQSVNSSCRNAVREIPRIQVV